MAIKLGHSNEDAIHADLVCSYLILLSRQGKVVGWPCPRVILDGLDLTRVEAPREVVHDTVAKGQGKDHQGCLAACTLSTGSNVQLP